MKTYVKPELFFESFELAQHIAGCALELRSGDVGSCDATGTIMGTNFGTDTQIGQGWFIAKSICAVEVEAYCYTNGTMSVATINS